MERNAVTTLVEPGQRTDEVLPALNHRPSSVLRAHDVGLVRIRGRRCRDEASIEMTGHKGIVDATVAVPDTICSSGALRLLTAYVAQYFDAAIESRGQVRTITVTRQQRPELVKALTAFARCFC